MFIFMFIFKYLIILLYMIKFAIIGAGYIGKRHATLIKENKSSELVAFIDIRSKIDCDIKK